MDKTIFIGITSAAGGSGLTGLSVTLARIIKRMNADSDCNILCLSFDALSSKMAPPNIEKMSVKRLLTRLIGGVDDLKEISGVNISKDEFGVSYLADNSFYNPLTTLSQEDLTFLLKTIADSKMFDYVILDIPFTCVNSMLQVSCCEHIIVNNGYLPSQCAINSMLFNAIKNYSSELNEIPELMDFTPIEDADSFSDVGVDLHGQYAAKVRELASKFISDN